MTGFERLSSDLVHVLTSSFLPPIFQACIIAEQSLVASSILFVLEPAMGWVFDSKSRRFKFHTHCRMHL